MTYKLIPQEEGTSFVLVDIDAIPKNYVYNVNNGMMGIHPFPENRDGGSENNLGNKVLIGQTFDFMTSIRLENSAENLRDMLTAFDGFADKNKSYLVDIARFIDDINSVYKVTVTQILA